VSLSRLGKKRLLPVEKMSDLRFATRTAWWVSSHCGTGGTRKQKENETTEGRIGTVHGTDH